MKYNPKKVAELIANRKDAELGKALQPRLRKIAEIVSTVKCGLDIQDTFGHFFAHYVSSGAYKDKETFSIHCESEGLLVFYCDEYFLPIDSIIIPIEFATCEDEGLKEVVVTQIYDDLYKHAEMKRREYKEAAEQVKKFLVAYDEFIGCEEETEAKGGEA